MTNSGRENLRQVVMTSEPSIGFSLLFEHDLSEKPAPSRLGCEAALFGDHARIAAIM
jgi:hypothetical protein